MTSLEALFAALAAVAAFGAFAGTAFLGNWISEELRGRLDRLPRELLRLATCRLAAEIRDDVAEEWTAELQVILHNSEGLPITRLCRGIRYALGLLRAAAGISIDISAAPLRLQDELQDEIMARLGQAFAILEDPDAPEDVKRAHGSDGDLHGRMFVVSPRPLAANSSDRWVRVSIWGPVRSEPEIEIEEKAELVRELGVGVGVMLEDAREPEVVRDMLLKDLGLGLVELLTSLARSPLPPPPDAA